MRQALMVAGPTCSGKSALALELARRLGGTVINADSMQVYRELRILTARPTPEDEAAVPHRLYGVRPAAEPGNAAWWREAAISEMAQAALPILCGGTGLYLQALAEGIADIPDPGAPARDEARALLAEMGPLALHRRLAEVDPDTAAGLRPSDSQRLARAWEVWRGTGQGIRAWQRSPRRPAPFRIKRIQLDPPRDGLRLAIAGRFDAMLASGAIEEAGALLALNLDPALPAMRAHGVPELTAYLRGETDLATARVRAVQATARYVKRQTTWFRNRPLPSCDVHTIDARFEGWEQLSEMTRARITTFVSGLG